MAVLIEPNNLFEHRIGVAVIGAGACGLTAALAASEAGAEVVIFERDARPYGLTGMSTGQIPAAGTRYQRAKGIEDAPEILAADFMAETRGQTDPDLALAVARLSGPTIEWLGERLAMPFEVIDDFTYHGHSRLRMHATPNRNGEELLGALVTAVEGVGIPIATQALVEDLVVDREGRVLGLVATRSDGVREALACDALVLACSGFAADRDLVARHCPDVAEAFCFSHPGNTGHALRWGEALGAKTADLGSYQAHASIAAAHGVQITWGTMREGGVQVNALGERFADESRGYSEAAADVLQQPGAQAWSIFDERIHHIVSQVDDYRQAVRAGAVVEAPDVPTLAARLGLPTAPLAATLAEADALAVDGGTDRFGRHFTPDKRLKAPYRAVKVTAALLHTQGGLCTDGEGRVLRQDSTPFPNLFAGGGAARGLAGPSGWGYLSGAGLLTAVALGAAAGRGAAAISLGVSEEVPA
ncbi:MAG TPA: FAD-dependent oxidoreductase [Beijerinckiaceae bacterium]|jgi:fumarate reductase flavoprotein subunit